MNGTRKLLTAATALAAAMFGAADAAAQLMWTPPPSPVQSLHIHPDAIRLDHGRDRQRVIVVAEMVDGTTRDVTTEAALELAEPIATWDDDFALRPVANGA